MTDYKELDMTIHENCIHYPICLVNDYIHNRCGYYFEKPKQGEWIKDLTENAHCTNCGLVLDNYIMAVFFNFCPNYGAKMEVQDDT